jgi:anti-sigma factor RsiW
MFFSRHNRSKMRRLISVYLDGELDPERASRLTAHLETCRQCRAEMAAQKELSSVLGAALEKEETPDILAGVLSALEDRKRHEHRVRDRVLRPVLRPALAYSFAAIFGIAVGILVSSSLGTSTTTATDTLPVQYLSEAPPNSLITLYYGDTGEVTDE